jgi:NAD(P)-dependent dehydrogenase (short-subunit alcohol dehydrogenase family)
LYLELMNSNEERVAIVTGASRGLGLATANALAGDGWALIIDSRDAEALSTAARGLDGSRSVKAIPGDVTDPGHRNDLVLAAEELGRLDLLVNNASKLGPSPQPHLADYPLDTLRQVYEFNTLAPLALLQAALPLLRVSGGAVVNVTSDAGTERYEGWGGYGSSKAALNQISNVLAAEEPDVAVYWFDPGDMNTQMHQEAFPGEDISDRPPPEESVPALLALLQSRPGSGFFRAADIEVLTR